MALGIMVASTLAIQQKRAATTLQSVLVQAQRDNAQSIWDRARQLCEEGRIGYGLLVLAKALETVPEGPENTYLRDAIKTDLAGWHRHCHTLQNVFVHPDKVLALACSPDGTLVVTGCADGLVRAWTLETGEIRWTSLAHTGEVTALAFAGSQTLLSAGSDGQVLIWETASGQQTGTLEGHENGIHCVAASPDGQWVLVGGADHEARLWDLAARTCHERWKSQGAVMTVGFSPDGRLFFMGGEGASGGPGEFHLYEMDSRQRVPINFRDRAAMTVRSAAISGFRGETLVLGDDNWETMFFDLSSGRRMLTTDYARGRVSAVAVAPRSATALVSTEDSQQVMLWDLRGVRRQWTAQQDGGITLTGQGGGVPRPLLPALAHPRAVTAVAFVPPTGRQFLTACEDGCVRLWRQAPGPSIRVLEHAPKSPRHKNREHVVRATAIHPSLPLGATAGEDGRVLLWDLGTAKLNGTPLQVNSPLRSVEFTPDGRAVVTCGKDGRVRVWDLRTRELMERPELPITAASSLSIGQSRNEILVGRVSGAERWDLDSGRRVGPVFQHGVENAEPNLETVISPNHERFLTTAEDGTARLWDASGKMLAELVHQNTARGGGFSPDNTLMVTASDDRTARVWDADSGAPRMSLIHDHEVLAAVFTDNHRVITGSRVGAQLWDVPLQRRLGPNCQFQHAVVDVSCTSDGRTALLADWDGYGIVWSIPEPIPGDADTIMLWVQTEVGMQLDDAGGREVLSGTAWLASRQRLLTAPSDSRTAPVPRHASP
jgi:WD40 repeat protein